MDFDGRDVLDYYAEANYHYPPEGEQNSDIISTPSAKRRKGNSGTTVIDIDDIPDTAGPGSETTNRNAWRNDLNRNADGLLVDDYLALLVSMANLRDTDYPPGWKTLQLSTDSSNVDVFGKFVYDLIQNTDLRKTSIQVDAQTGVLTNTDLGPTCWFRQHFSAMHDKKGRDPGLFTGPLQRRPRGALFYEEVAVLLNCVTESLNADAETWTDPDMTFQISFVDELKKTMRYYAKWSETEVLDDGRERTTTGFKCRPLFAFLRDANHYSVIMTIDGIDWYHVDSIQGQMHREYAERWLRTVYAMSRTRDPEFFATQRPNWRPVYYNVYNLVMKNRDVHQPREIKTVYYQNDQISCLLLAYLNLDYFLFTLGNKYPFYSEPAYTYAQTHVAKEWELWNQGIVDNTAVNSVIKSMRTFCKRVDYILSEYAPAKPTQRVGAAKTTSAVQQVVFPPQWPAAYDPEASGFYWD